jgi:hypothetical protein
LIIGAKSGSFVFRNALLLVLAALATASGRWVDSAAHELTAPTDLEASTMRKEKLYEGPNPRSWSCKGRIKKLAFTREASDFYNACRGYPPEYDDKCSLCVRCRDDGKLWFGTYEVGAPPPCTYRCTSDPRGRMFSQACPAGWTVVSNKAPFKPGLIDVPDLQSYEAFLRERYGPKPRHANYRDGPFGGHND